LLLAVVGDAVTVIRLPRLYVSCFSGAILLPFLLVVAPAHSGGPQLLRVEGAEEGGAPFPPDGGARLSLGKGEPPGLAWGPEGRAELPDAVNTTFSTRAGRHRVIGLDSARGEVLDLVGAGVPKRVRVRELAGVDAAGVAHDPDQDALYVLDRHVGAILRVTPLAPGVKGCRRWVAWRSTPRAATSTSWRQPRGS
jgi:hypothetical protein